MIWSCLDTKRADTNVIREITCLPCVLDSLSVIAERRAWRERAIGKSTITKTEGLEDGGTMFVRLGDQLFQNPGASFGSGRVLIPRSREDQLFFNQVLTCHTVVRQDVVSCLYIRARGDKSDDNARASTDRCLKDANEVVLRPRQIPKRNYALQPKDSMPLVALSPQP